MHGDLLKGRLPKMALMTGLSKRYTVLFQGMLTAAQHEGVNHRPRRSGESQRDFGLEGLEVQTLRLLQRFSSHEFAGLFFYM